MAFVAEMIKIDLEGKSVFSPKPVPVVPKDAQLLRGRQFFKLRGKNIGERNIGVLRQLLRGGLNLGKGEALPFARTERDHQQEGGDEGEREVKSHGN